MFTNKIEKFSFIRYEARVLGHFELKIHKDFELYQVFMC